MKKYIKPEVKVYRTKLSLCLLLKAEDKRQKGLPNNMTIFSLMRKMVTDILVAAVFGTTKTLKTE